MAEVIKRIEIRAVESMSIYDILPNSDIPKTNFLAEAKFYLEDNKWDQAKAVQKYEEDLNFEMKKKYGYKWTERTSQMKVKSKKKCEIF